MNLSGIKSFFAKNYKIFVTILAFVILYLLFFYRLDIKLLFSDTILTGGDTASWYQSAQTLRDEFIPHGRLFGHSMANFFGYTELLHYFCVPFLIAVILSIFMPLTVALKITTVLGAFTLPIAFFVTTKKITKNFWIAIASIFLSLVFVFNESYTMFGGNLLSTFAGEFCYSISITVFVFFLGYCYEAFMEGKKPIIAGLLLGLCGLCHLFVFMVAFFVPFFFIFVGFITDKVNQNGLQNKKKNKKSKSKDKEEKILIPFNKNGILEKILWTYVIGFLLMSFWLIPMACTRNLAQTISMIWRFPSFKDFFQQSFLALIIIGVLFDIIMMITSKKHRVISLFFGYIYLVCVFFYIISIFLEVPDIRFIPPALIMSLFSILVTVSYVPESKTEEDNTKQLLRKCYFPLIAVACCIGVSIFVINVPKTTTGWYKWNYTGYEDKTEWNSLKQIINQYHGDLNSGRLLWEKQNQNDNKDFGSERAFENLKLFTGRPSTEGVHYGSSFMARSTTYMQSEYSLNPVDPEAWRLYSTVNPQGWPTRFYITNSKDIIVYSDEIKSKFAAHKDFEKTGSFSKFDIYTFKYAPQSYIRVTDNENVSVIADNKYGFKTDFYRAFRDYELFDKPFVPAKYAKDLTSYTHYKDYDTYRLANFDNNYNFDKWLENYKYKNSITNENVNGFDIKFTTNEIGKPHIIGVSYSINFKSKHGEKIYPVSPGFMMIIPTTNDVHVYYGWNKFEIVGLILTILLIPCLIFYKRLDKFRLPCPQLLTKIAISIFSILIVFFLVISLAHSRKIYTDLNVANNYMNNGMTRQALDIANKYITKDNIEKYDNALMYDYLFLKARILKNGSPEERKEAKKIYDYLQFRYNHSRYNESHKLYF